MDSLMLFGAEAFDLRPDRQEVFGWLRCEAELPCYDAFLSAWPKAVSVLREHARPRAGLCLAGEEAMTVFLTLGTAVEKQVDVLFQQGEYVLASLLNTLCDEILFQCNHQLSSRLQELLAAEHRFFAARLEPGVDYAPDLQRRFFEPLRAVFPEARISETGVLSPAKSMMYRVVLSRQDCGEHALHDCSKCSQKDCPYRK